MAIENKPDISTPMVEYKEAISDWNMVEDILGGTKKMRELGEKYLPRHAAESEENYRIRLKTATFAPLFQLLTESMTGRAFAKGIAVDGVKDGVVEALMNNIDGAGTNLAIFLQDAFQMLIDSGLIYIFVDFQKGLKTKTMEEESKSGARPYFVAIKGKNVPYFKYKNGSNEVAEVRIIETETDEDSGKEIEKIRVLKPGLFEIYEKKSDAKGVRWVLEESGPMSIPFVPVVQIYAKRNNGVPPLIDAAYLNVKYYQFESNHDNALTVAQFPILCGTGYNLDEGKGKVQLGPKKLLHSPSPETKFFYLEHSGVAINCGKIRLEDIKAEIAAMGMKLLSAKAQGEQGKTATENVLDDKQNTCVLETIVHRFEDAVKVAIGYLGSWIKKDFSEVKVKIVGSFQVERKDSNELNALIGLKQAGDLSQKTLWEEFKRRGVLSDKFNEEKEKALISLEGPSFMSDSTPEEKPVK